MRTLIQKSVSRANLRHTFDCTSTRDILVALRKRFCPTEEYREQEVEDAYKKVQAEVIGKSVDVEAWLSRWEDVHVRAVKVKLPDVQGKRDRRDFLSAVNHVSPEFSSYWQNRMLNDTLEHGIPDFTDLVSKFREYRARTPRGQKAGQHGVFGAQATTFQGRDKDGKRSLCLCGVDHRFSKCAYLVPQRRTQGWKPDAAI